MSEDLILPLTPHDKVEGNEKGNKLAKSATTREIVPPLTVPIRVAACALNKIKKLSLENWKTSYAAAKGGKHTRNLDKALPNVHTKVLYHSFPQPKAAILAQLRTGKCKLKAYLHKIGAEESDLCDEWGQTETVKHVLLDCRRWRTERKELWEAVKDRSRRGDMPYLLGGWSGRKNPMGKYIDGEASTWKPDMGAVRATVDFAVKTGIFNTRGLGAEGQARQLSTGVGN